MNSGGKIRYLLMGVLLTAVAAAGLTSVAEAAKPRIKCAYAQAGPAGLAGNRLNIRVNGQEESTAVRVLPGGRIEVSDDQRMHRLRCAGRKPTVTNIDTIDYRATRASETTNFTVADPLAFAPGTRAYEDGGSGISFKVVGKAVSFGVVGTDGDDAVLAGRKGRGLGVDFGQEPASNGIDAKVYAGFINLLVILDGGNDFFDGSGFTYFDGPMTTASSLYGGEGNDQLQGGNGIDYIDGGEGSDSLTGLGGADTLSGGRGIDGFDAGPGADEIDAIDRRPELIECGPGKDLSAMDLVDDDSNCEMFSFP